jgi:ubiquinone/menaquinone biosynthesis C-methylase UbiE
VAAYDLLAPYYDAATGDAATETAFIEAIINDAHPNPVALLEVACGTGGIINSLAGRYRVAGLDISPGMLAVARGKLPEETPLQVADMSRFELDARFDAVFCVYYGVNHLLSFSAWQGFFDCAYRHLNEGGVLAFDTFTAGDLKVVAGTSETVQQFGENSLRIRVRASGEVTFDWDIEAAVQRNGQRELLTEVIRTAAFPPHQIREALSERFTDIKIIETDGGISEGGSRIWFVCTRPHSGV